MSTVMHARLRLRSEGSIQESRYLQCSSQAHPADRVRDVLRQGLKHPCIINTVFSTNPKHGPIQATIKKINSIPAKTSTMENEMATC